MVWDSAAPAYATQAHYWCLAAGIETKLVFIPEATRQFFYSDCH